MIDSMIGAVSAITSSKRSSGATRVVARVSTEALVGYVTFEHIVADADELNLRPGSSR